MKGDKLQKQITKMRIVFQNLCDGFDTKNANKTTTLSMRLKVLFLLSETDKISPSSMIRELGLAKSNLALLCKTMLVDGVISIDKLDQDKRNVYYSITDKGQYELNEYFLSIGNSLSTTFSEREQKSLERKFDEILDILKKKGQDK